MKTDSEILRDIANRMMSFKTKDKAHLRRIADQLESEQPKKMRTMLQDAINESDQLQQQEVSEGDMIKEISMSGNSWLSDYAFGFRHGVKWMQSKLKGNG